MNRKFICFVPTCLLTICLYAQHETASWFEFKPSRDFTGSRITMNDWLDAPAGKHGIIRIEKEKFVFKDNTPVKFWGVNIASKWAFVSSEEAWQWADYLAAYGVNSVRFHKFTEPGMSGNFSTGLDSNKQTSTFLVNNCATEEYIMAGRIFMGTNPNLETEPNCLLTKK